MGTKALLLFFFAVSILSWTAEVQGKPRPKGQIQKEIEKVHMELDLMRRRLEELETGLDKLKEKVECDKDADCFEVEYLVPWVCDSKIGEKVILSKKAVIPEKAKALIQSWVGIREQVSLLNSQSNFLHSELNNEIDPYCTPPDPPPPAQGTPRCLPSKVGFRCDRWKPRVPKTKMGKKSSAGP